MEQLILSLITFNIFLDMLAKKDQDDLRKEQQDSYPFMEGRSRTVWSAISKMSSGKRNTVRSRKIEAIFFPDTSGRFS